MMRFATLLIILLAGSIVSSCGSGETYWAESKAAVEQYLGHIKAGRFAEAHAMHDEAYPVYGKPDSKDDFVKSMQQQAALWPGLNDFEWELTRGNGSVRTRLYTFIADLTWKSGYPAQPGTEVTPPSGEKLLPVLGPKMLAAAVNRRGQWWIQGIRIYSEPLDLFSNKK